jgi:tRNA (guanine37-N1)-methyltransferase
LSDEGGVPPLRQPRIFATVPRPRGEEARGWLAQNRLLDVHARILTDDARVLLPLSEASVPGAATPLEAAEAVPVRDDGRVDAGDLGPAPQAFATHFAAAFEVRETEIRTRDRGDYQRLADVPPDVRALLPQGYDQVGDIAVVKFTAENRRWEAEVADAILRATKGVRAVVADEGVSGERRLRTVRKVGGEGPLTTVHKEFGLAIEVDLERAFFTPRLAGERRRVALEVAPAERVLDAFAGVGPITLHIARAQPTVTVVAVDVSKDAIALLRANGARNKLTNIEAHAADFHDFARGCKSASFTRVVMNLPHRAKEYLPDALPLVVEGGIIHLYAILPLDEVLPEQGALRRLGAQAGRDVTILRARPIKSYSPRDLYIAFDLRVDNAAGP